MKPKIHIASCSFGKDSIATILLALEHKEPLDRIVFAEVMFDHNRGISGEIPEHIDWIRNVAIPKIESLWGGKVDVVRSQKDYMYFFSKSRGGGKYKGKLCGYPIGGKCVLQRGCKVNAIHKYHSQFKDYDIVQYVGIAIDEPRRLERLKGGKISLLAKYGYTEKMARELCERYGLLSPIYKIGPRSGCWFCPNTKLSTMLQFRKVHPDLWGELTELGKTPNLCSYRFKYELTIAQVNAKLDSMERQIDLFND